MHEQFLLGILDENSRQLGADTRRQVPVRAGHRTRYIDMVIELGGKLVAVEAERSARRVANDVDKAINLGADELWIVCPIMRCSRP